MSDPLSGLKEATELLKLTYPDLLQPATKVLGADLGTVIEWMSLPLLRMRYTIAEKKIKYAARLKKLIAELDQIPASERREIPGTVGAPAFDHLALESDDDIAKLFIQLLRTSASSRTAKYAHPSFVACIRSLSGDEARLLRLLRAEPTIASVKIRLNFSEEEGLDKTGRLTGLERKIGLDFPENISLYLDNLVGLGLLSIGEGRLSDTAKWYQPLFRLYEPLLRQIEAAGHSDGKKYPVGWVTSYLLRTSYCDSFLKACMGEQ